MEHQANIVFQLIETSREEESETECSETICRVFLKIIDVCKVDDTVTGKYIIQEDAVEVQDLNLTKNEFETLKDIWKNYFSQDAFQLLASNYEVCSKHEGYIFKFIRIQITRTGCFIIHTSSLNLVISKMTP